MINSSFLKISTSASLVCAVLLSQGAFADVSATADVNQQAVHTNARKATSSNADNSGVNKRDQMNGEVTADQQTSGTADTEITRQIRRALIADKNLSIYAHNIKIITIAGVVTLKGPVKSADEKTKAVAFAKSAAGVSRVDDQISIKR